jgi:hypothetical protein
VCITDSIIQASTAPLAISITTAKLNIERSTVFGDVSVHQLYASDCIMTGVVTVEDNQTGCFRFSTTLSASRIPKRYRSPLFETSPAHWFGSTEFGQPQYAQLSDVVPDSIYRGGSNRAEMGAFNSLMNAIKYDGVRLKVEEYMPFGLIPAYINET